DEKLRVDFLDVVPGGGIACARLARELTGEEEWRRGAREHVGAEHTFEVPILGASGHLELPGRHIEQLAVDVQAVVLAAEVVVLLVVGADLVQRIGGSGRPEIEDIERYAVSDDVCRRDDTADRLTADDAAVDCGRT